VIDKISPMRVHAPAQQSGHYTRHYCFFSLSEVSTLRPLCLGGAWPPQRDRLDQMEMWRSAWTRAGPGGRGAQSPERGPPLA
jgi:hypothetical protein